MADRRVALAGLTEDIDVLLCDYRELFMPREGPCDKIVSIETTGVVGLEFLVTCFEGIHKLPKPDK
jgi:cyclopropane-fatty-acyl-phospholipid synthase